MKKILIGLILALLVAVPGMAMEVNKADFEVKTAQDLVDLCSVSSSDPLYPHAVNFCHGYVVGAYHYHEAAAQAKYGTKFVCIPDSAPSRNEIIAMFVKWAGDNPQYMTVLPVNAQFRFLEEMYPCGK